MLPQQILLVEDDPLECQLARRALSKIDPDIGVTHLADGQALLDYLSESPAESISLAIMDLNMPRRNGLATLEYLREQGTQPPFPIVMFSSSDDPDDVRRAYQLGAAAYVVKPVGGQQYRQTMQRIVDFWLSTNRIR
ncbi:response regulator [Lewinella sp. IMCC34183]|uniref:response regulator n=1 Tax=Lewinella sp. IMCC34183 TaxID=2248762 RepID=UPI000E243B68|nr:response regulator [Lewinella sp. IMCC34183]